MVSEGRVITVNISLGKKDGVVPRIIDMDYKAAEEYLQSFGFELGIVKTVTSTKPEGVIVSQSIDAGTTADSGTKIDVEISDGKGKEMVQVPSVVGKTWISPNQSWIRQALRSPEFHTKKMLRIRKTWSSG